LHWRRGLCTGIACAWGREVESCQCIGGRFYDEKEETEKPVCIFFLFSSGANGMAMYFLALVTTFSAKICDFLEKQSYIYVTNLRFT
jgi:hypothetical protein